MVSCSCRESIKIYCESLGLSLSEANIETKSSISIEPCIQWTWGCHNTSFTG